MTSFGFVRLDMRQSPAAFATSERPSIEFDLGIRHRLQRGYLSAAFTENLQHYNNTPHFGFQISAGLAL